MPSKLNKTIRVEELTIAREVRTFPNVEGGGIGDEELQSGIYQGEVIAALEAFPAESFDLIIADPPYNLGRDFGNESDKRTALDYAEWTREWIAKLPRVLTMTGSIYICCHWQHSGMHQRAIEDAGLTILNRITWKREKGRGAKKNWKQNMEDIWFATRSAANYTFNLEAIKVVKPVIAPYRENGKPKDWIESPDGERTRLTHPSNIWTDLTVPFWSMPENTEHPTQKPEKLIERIMLASSSPGDRVLDLFSGSGTTSVVAQRLGRRFIGIELNPDFVRLGLERLNREANQG